ncbi:Ig-like domain-containing protein [Kribbella sp. VKM Ac-2527]|uniref:Ig-like domain-containing protein n=1 Tax=Kribbella caucasensis TaxID=2512215 RepID=A0A4R6J4U2_9ACTN|nr:pre-peptidase C-terminal domain-containing protein [Kribbella sp. VKM Ac-2527]TDO30007.1 Ig-like domain-containing protein [Kribbella sp. VKM Ac-2527]
MSTRLARIKISGLRAVVAVTAALAVVVAASVVSLPQALAAPPGNDDFGAAEQLTGTLPIQVSASNVDATKEPGEPDHGGNAGGSSIWFSWTAPATGPVVIDVCGSNVKNQVGVYTGSAVNALTSAVSADEACDGYPSTSRLVRLAAAAGTTYWIAVDGYNGATGDLELVIRNAPANDGFAAAEVLGGSLPIAVTGSNFGATGEPGEPAHAGTTGRHSIWYSWTPAASGPITIATCASDFDTVLGVYTGTTVTALTEVVANDNGCGTKSAVTFAAAAGTTYRIAVDGVPGEEGSTTTGTVELRVRTAVVPPNDDFGAAQTIDGPLPISTTSSNIDATKQPNEPAHAGNSGGTSVWFNWTAAESGQMTISTCLSTFDTLLGVYTGSAVGSLTAVASNDDSCGTGSVARFAATAGTTYRIAVDGYAGATGTIQLKLVSAPANDDFAAAQVLSGPLPITATGTNVGATKQAGEPDDIGGGGATVWYSWTAAATGPVTISSCASGVSTKLGVYTGTDVTALTVVPVRDLRCTNRAKVSLQATAGTTYRIVIDGAAFSDGSPMTGPIGLTIRPSSPPANDDFANAEVLSGAPPLTVSGSTADATDEAGDPLGGPSVWYSWTAAASGVVIVSTCSGSGADTRLGIYTGDAIGGLSEVTGEDRFCGFGAARIVTVAAGTTYRIGVSGQYPNEFGGFTLTIRTPVRPANDAFADAQALDGPLPLSVTGTTTDASTETGEPDGGNSVWYSWTAEAAGPVDVDTCDSGLTGDSALAVFTGTTVGALTEIAANGDSCGSLSRVTFTAAAGTTYKIRVSGEVGSFRLRLRVPHPPSNDDFANAAVLTGALPLSASGTNVEASRESGEPLHDNGRGYASVWYSWTATVTGRMSIDTCGSDFDTVLGVYTGSAVSGLGRVASNDNGCGAAAAGSKVAFNAVSGTTYRIAVDGHANNSGGASAEGSVELTIKAVNLPANDNRADAQTLSATLPVSATGTNVGATKEPGEFNHVGNVGGASVWYRWTAAAGGPVTVDTCDAGFATLLAVYVVRPDGQLGSAAANRNACGNGARDTFIATAGTSYLLAVDGADGAQGNFTLNLRAADRPANDNFTDATELTGALPITATGTNVEATRETSEPRHAGTNGGASVWFSWTALATGRISIDTCGSSFDTVLGVYTGSAVGGLTVVASNDNSCGTRSQVTFTAVSGTTYRIAVDGPVRNSGSIRLVVRAPAQPANDDFADALGLTGALPIEVSGTTVDATREGSEPFHGGLLGTASVWYRWTAATAGKVVVETCGSSFDTLLGVYTGLEVGDLSTVAINGDACGSQSRVEFAAIAGTTYWIAVDGGGGASGAVRLTVRPPQRPANDAFAAAQSLGGTLPVAVAGTNVDATREGSEPFHGGLPGSASVWYSWTPSATRRVTIDTCGGEVNTVLAVYTGGALADLNNVASDNDGCGRSYGGSRVTFTATAGTTYRIAVDGIANPGIAGALPGTGALDLRLTAADPPANDDFAAARVLTGFLPIAWTGTNAGATRESGEPFHAGFVGGTSVWFSWTPTLSGRVAIDTCARNFDTLLAVYTGSSFGTLNPVAGNNNGCGSASKVTFTAAAGTTYRIAVDGRGEAAGSIALAITDLEPRAATVTTLTSTPNPSSYGQPVTVTATVTGGSTTPTGEVQFVVDGTDSGTPRPLVTGKASISLPGLAVGAHTLTARYTGDATHAPSSGSTSQQVNRMATRLVAHPAVLEILPLRITLRLSATLTDATGQPLPGQQVRFVLSDRTVCTATTAANGRASCTSTGAWLAAVLHLGYDAHYDGTPTHQPSHAHGGVLG